MINAYANGHISISYSKRCVLSVLSCGSVFAVPTQSGSRFHSLSAAADKRRSQCRTGTDYRYKEAEPKIPIRFASAQCLRETIRTRPFIAEYTQRNTLNIGCKRTCITAAPAQTYLPSFVGGTNSSGQARCEYSNRVTNKGYRSDCNNHSGISLLSVVRKVFAHVVLARLYLQGKRIYHSN